ncbi:MAG: nicotinate phosphoribosyltransferase [Candidatus Omnitrophica bacterium CG11_big_fil_rev_8_21_14_0_20_42_13]|uniref:Nicotinate phosphoribosyltransferase n=1 Tax=Candidatus Ghiorseimicrobium undicola TaxID=1974746 RepID=A0A2H0LYX8_9BACT|nr:MAG: nicotinate phosphoribosyltransferase [Candidatus Omnitrophica bacterium CG11_big_fil_rev_8_21_14_0_20_42_13]
MPFEKENILLTDLYELTMCASYFDNNLDCRATFDLFIRNLPRKRSYFIAAGLDEALTYLKNFRFRAGDIEFLKSKGLFKKPFLSYLSRFKFTGDVYAMPEGTVFFPNEPVLRVSAPIIEAQLAETFLLNAVNLATTLATKASRVVTAAGYRPVVDFSLRRTQGMHAGLAAARSSYIAGCAGTSNVLAGRKYGIPIYGTMAHSFVMSFESEEKSFEAYLKTFPLNSVLLVDTYDTLKGVARAAEIAKKLEKKGNRLSAIRLDSGDLRALSKKARAILDRNKLKYVKIFASGNLDEYKIAALLKNGARIDAFGVGTAMGVSKDAPYCDVIYKLSELNQGRKTFPVMKLSKAKVTYPGIKQVFRIKDGKGNYLKDVLGLADEKIKGQPLLIKVMEKGRVLHGVGLEKIRHSAARNLEMLPAKYKRLSDAPVYPVQISPGLQKLAAKLSKRIRRQNGCSA